MRSERTIKQRITLLETKRQMYDRQAGTDARLTIYKTNKRKSAQIAAQIIALQWVLEEVDKL
jgi:ribosomal protein L18